MSANTTLLGLNQPTTGGDSGIWGDDINNGTTQLIEVSLAGTNNITYDGDVTLSVTNGNNSSSFASTVTTSTSTATAQYAVLNLSGSRASARNIIAPASSKIYLVTNATTVSYTLKKSAGTGITIAAGETCIAYYNTVSGDYAKGPTSVTGAAAAGTLTGTTLASNVVTSSLTAVGTIATGVWNGSIITGTYGGTGVNNGSSTITIGGSVTFSGAYTFSGTLSANTAITFPTTGALAALGNANTWTATQTFSGTSSTFATSLLNASEPATVSATAATGTINFYVNSQSVLYYTSNASANWTLNVAFSSGTSLNTAMSTGQTVTIAFLVTQGTTAYYENVFQIDGTNVTPKWQGGTAPSAGNASGIDVYTYTITKTASATYTVLASQTQFK